MHPLIRTLTEQRPALSDGAWGTLLQAKGLEPGECPDAWNLTHPDAVLSVATAYVEAGSDVILTNTFRSNRISLDPYGHAEDVERINRAGVELSRRAAGNRAKVFASMGPSGKMLMMEDITEEQLSEAFSEQAKVLAQAGADALLLETMSDVTEAKLALTAALKVGLPVVVSMVFDTGKEKDRTMTGLTPEQVARELTLAGADVIGANCGLGIEGILPICARMRTASDLPLWIKPNAGLPQVIQGRIVYATTPEDFAGLAPSLVHAGAAFVGGCCGTTPAHIAALHKMLRPTHHSTT